MECEYLFDHVPASMNNSIGFIDILRSSASLKIKFFKGIDYLLGSALAAILPSAPQTGVNFKTIKEVLIIRPGGMGDAVVLLPVINQFKKQYPDIQIDILCERRNWEVFSSQAQWKKNAYCYDRIPEISKVLNKRYDVVIDTEQWHYLSVILGFFLKRQALIGFATRVGRRRLLDVGCDYDTKAYEMDNFLRLFEPWQLQRKEIHLDGSWTVDEASRTWAKQKISGRYAVLSSLASIAERRLNEQQIDLITKELQSQDLQVFLLEGQFNLAQVAAIIQNAQAFIGVDSGLLHVAAAVGVPVTGIFGPGQVFKWAPQGTKHHSIHHQLPCSPCTRFGYTIPTCQGKIPCMRDLNLNIEEIYRRRQ